MEEIQSSLDQSHNLHGKVNRTCYPTVCPRNDGEKLYPMLNWCHLVAMMSLSQPTTEGTLQKVFVNSITVFIQASPWQNCEIEDTFFPLSPFWNSPPGQAGIMERTNTGVRPTQVMCIPCHLLAIGSTATCETSLGLKSIFCKMWALQSSLQSHCGEKV